VGIEGLDFIKANLDYTPQNEEVRYLGRKIGRVGLTDKDILYVSEETPDEDLQRAEAERQKNPKEFEEREKELVETVRKGWKH